MQKEYIEAVSFLEFLLNERLITMEEINERLRSPEVRHRKLLHLINTLINIKLCIKNSSFSISMKDYILGVAGTDIFDEFFYFASSC